MWSRPEGVMPGFHERDGGMLGEDTKAERFLGSHVAFSAVVVLWIYALGEAFLGSRLRASLGERYPLFAAQSLERQKHATATLLMHAIFVPLSVVGLALVPFWAADFGAAPVVARAVAWIDASFLLLWELRELFLIDLKANKALVAHHASTCVIIVAILDFDLLRDITWLQLLFLAANTAWLQRPVTLLSKFVDDRRVLVLAKRLGLAGVALDVVQLVCAGWFFVACSAMGNFGAAFVVLGAALPISYLRVQVNRWVCRFDPDFALQKQKERLDKLEEGTAAADKEPQGTQKKVKEQQRDPALQPSASEASAVVHFDEADAVRARWLATARRSSSASS